MNYKESNLKSLNAGDLFMINTCKDVSYGPYLFLATIGKLSDAYFYAYFFGEIVESTIYDSETITVLEQENEFEVK